MEDLPTRDEVLDAYDVLIRAGSRQLRVTLDAVYEDGYRDAVRSFRKKSMNSGEWPPAANGDDSVDVKWVDADTGHSA